MTRAVVLLGFGGPAAPEEIRPFLAHVLRNRPVPPERIEAVVSQYMAIGGRSPYNTMTENLAEALRRRLNLPVYIGHRHAAPWAADTFKKMVADGVTEAVAVPLAAYRCTASYHEYLKAAAEAYRASGSKRMRLRFVQPWHDHPLFAQAVADRVRETWEAQDEGFRAAAAWFFTAHSIPVPMDQEYGYSRQIEDVARRVVRQLGAGRWELTYQSRSGRPGDPWLEPDVAEVLSRRGGAAFLIPVGFLMDHVEVLYDLDVRARESVEAAGGIYARAKTVGEHPVFLHMLQELIDAQWTKLPAVPGPRRSARRFAVVGGGITGLAAAHRLLELSPRGDAEVMVFEAGGRAGGVIETRRDGGCLLESGPDSFITEKPAAVALAGRLGMDAALIGTNRGHARSFVAKDGRLHPTPEGFYLLAPSKLGALARSRLLSWPGKLRAAAELVLPPRRVPGDETLASFVRRRFGGEVLDRLAQPMVAGIYSADPERLSLAATFPRFLEMEARAGSVIRALWKVRRPADRASGPRYGLFAAFEDGMSSLPDRLAAKLPLGALRLHSRVDGLRREGAAWRLAVNGKENFEADAVCLALPAPAAATTIQEASPALAAVLREIPYNGVATVNAVAARAQVGHALDGFGFVVPAREGRAITGCTFSSVKFAGRAPTEKVLLRAFLPGEFLAKADEEIMEAAWRDLSEFLSIKGGPESARLARYPGAMPQYTLGHLERAARAMALADAQPGLALAGNGYFGIGIPDCIAQGEKAAEKLLAAAAA